MAKKSRFPLVSLALALVVLLSACLSMDDIEADNSARASKAAESKATAASKAPESKASEVDWPARIAKFEKENAIDRKTEWGGVVTNAEVKFNNSLWVYTSLPADAEAKALASRICGAYGQFALDYPEVSVTFVRAGDGQQIAKCGPGA